MHMKTRIYHITMASVEPAGMMPNLNCSFGRSKSGSSSARFFGKVKGGKKKKKGKRERYIRLRHY